MSGVKLVGIVTSLRVGSVNGAAARAATRALPDDVSLILHDVGDLPLFNEDHETAGPPESVAALFDAVRDADGIVLFSPEYNSSLPAVTKNVIDWLSRDPSTWAGTGITMVSMSPGGRAAIGAREHFEAIMPRQSSRVFPSIGFGNYSERVNESGEVDDQATLDSLSDFLRRFSEFCATDSD